MLHICPFCLFTFLVLKDLFSSVKVSDGVDAETLCWGLQPVLRKAEIKG